MIYSWYFLVMMDLGVSGATIKSSATGQGADSKTSGGRSYSSHHQRDASGAGASTRIRNLGQTGCFGSSNALHMVTYM